VIPADKITAPEKLQYDKGGLKRRTCRIHFLTVIIDVSFAQLPETNSQFHLINKTFNAKQD
jgi:hypothetical protein